MDLNEYQLWTRTTAIYPADQADVYLSLGLVSEAGEVAGKLKKWIRDKTLNTTDLLHEVGDCLWYIARLSDELGVTMEELASAKYEKLEGRRKRSTIGGSGDNR